MSPDSSLSRGHKHGLAIGFAVAILLAALTFYLGFGVVMHSMHQADRQELSAAWGQPQSCPITGHSNVAGEYAEALAREVTITCPDGQEHKAAMPLDASNEPTAEVWRNRVTGEVWILNDALHGETYAVTPPMQRDHGLLGLGIVVLAIALFFIPAGIGLRLASRYDRRQRELKDPRLSRAGAEPAQPDEDY